MDTYGSFRDWFWRPPRAHGEVIRDRTVSPVELLYDLVYVVVISQAAHILAEDVSELASTFSGARIWGPSARFDGQRVGREHILQDTDTVEIV